MANTQDGPNVKSDKSKMPVRFSEQDPESVPVKPDPKKAKVYKKAAREASAFAKFGVTVLKIKQKALAELGGLVEDLGVKKVGHGKIMLASDHAEETISMLDDIVHNLMEEDPNANHDKIVTLLQLKREFNRQLIESGQAHMSADKQPVGNHTANSISVAFPVGRPMVVAVGNQKQPEIEDGSKAP